jgi:hypothetical protein
MELHSWSSNQANWGKIDLIANLNMWMTYWRTLVWKMQYQSRHIWSQMDIFILMRKNFGSRHFYCGYIDSMVLVEVLRKILSNDPNWYTKLAKKKVSKANKEKETRTVRQLFTDRLYRSQNLTETLDVWTTILDRPLLIHGLPVNWPRTVRPCRTDCPYALRACEITKVGT